jgi:predicted transcriptional regulator
MDRERRRPQQQTARVDGRRDTDPTLTTSDCARRLGVSTKFIVGEIRDARLKASVRSPGRVRKMYRIAPADFDRVHAEILDVRQHRQRIAQIAFLRYRRYRRPVCLLQS